MGDGAAEGFFRDVLRRLEDYMPNILRKLLKRSKVNLPVPRRKMVVVEILDIV